MTPDTAPATETRVPALLGRLRELLLDIYMDREADFQELVETKFEYEYGVVVKGGTFKERVQHTIIAFKGDGGIEHVVALAKAVSADKPKRKDLQNWITSIRKQLDPPSGGNDLPAAAPGGEVPLPTELAVSLQLLEQRTLTMGQFIRDVRQALRLRDYTPFGLFDRFHLDDPIGHRAVAIMQLEVRPDVKTARWLAERVTVEPPPIAFMAAKSLTMAAFRCPACDLAAVSRCIDGATGRLDLTSDAPEDPAEFDVAARKRELIVAKTLIEMRTRRRPGLMSPPEVDDFLRILEGLDRTGLEALCVRAHTTLRIVARPTDPLEHIVLNIAVQAREKNWEADLIHAAAAGVAGDARLAELAKQYPVAGPGQG
jgi:hypothetical protein